MFFWGDLTPKDVRGRRREVVFDLQSLFQCASFPERIRRGVFFPMDGGEWSAETSSSVRGAETLFLTYLNW